MPTWVEHIQTSFRLGISDVCLSDLLSERFLDDITKKFSVAPDTLFIALPEQIRVLFLQANFRGSLFFRGDELMDNLWHALITETSEYRSLCDKLSPGAFVDHTSVPYDDYAAQRTPKELHEERLSWLTSYV